MRFQLAMGGGTLVRFVQVCSKQGLELRSTPAPLDLDRFYVDYVCTKLGQALNVSFESTLLVKALSTWEGK